MKAQRWTLSFAACVALAAIPGVAAAQESSRARVDSLAAEVRRLRAQLDSLRQVLAELRAEGERRRVQSEIERLREEARRAAAEAEREDQEQEPVFLGRERTQQLLNPEISITGDVVGFGRLSRDGTEGELTAIPREFEFSFQTAIDPYARMKIFVARHEEVPFEIEQDPAAEEEHGGFEIEEAYAYWVGLPGGLGLDVGKFQQQAGILNRWHTHAWPEADFPLALREILGHEGLAQTGASAYWLAPWSGGAGAYELWLQVAAASNDRLFPESNAPTALAHLNNYWDLSDATYLQIGFTGAFAEDDDADALRTRLAGVDLTLNWRPPERALYREFTLRSEWMWTDQRTATAGESSAWGGYAAVYYKLGARWRAGVRYDYLEPAEPAAQEVWQVVPTLTRWWTEFLRLRAQWNHLRDGDETDNQLLLQLVWAVGPHREDVY